MSVRINTKDLARMNHLFDELKAYPNVVKEEIENIAIDSVEDAVGIAPVDTGNLKQNIGLAPIAGGYQIHSNATYSRFVEEGTRRNHAQPFFFKSVRKNIKEAIARLTVKLKSL